MTRGGHLATIRQTSSPRLSCVHHRGQPIVLSLGRPDRLPAPLDA